MGRYYKREHEKELIELIRKLKAERKSVKDIAAVLNQMGMKNAQGDEWNVNRLCTFITGRRRALKLGPKRRYITGRSKLPKTEAAPKTRRQGGGLDAVASLCTDPNLSDLQFRRATAAILNVTY